MLEELGQARRRRVPTAGRRLLRATRRLGLSRSELRGARDRLRVDPGRDAHRERPRRGRPGRRLRSPVRHPIQLRLLGRPHPRRRRPRGRVPLASRLTWPPRPSGPLPHAPTYGRPRWPAPTLGSARSLSMPPAAPPDPDAASQRMREPRAQPRDGPGHGRADAPAGARPRGLPACEAVGAGSPTARPGPRRSAAPRAAGGPAPAGPAPRRRRRTRRGPVRSADAWHAGRRPDLRHPGTHPRARRRPFRRPASRRSART